MDLNLATALSEVKVAIRDAADKSSLRRLRVYSETPCKPACAACCNRLIYITTAEAIIIQEHLEKTGQWPEVEKRARALLLTSRDAQPVSWFKMNIMCPVLDPVSRLCTAYETRPTPCSTHFVQSKPELCDPWSLKSGGFESLDFMDLHEEFLTKLEKVIDGYGMLALKFPMSIALIFAARIKVQSGLGAREMINLIFNELT